MPGWESLTVAELLLGLGAVCALWVGLGPLRKLARSLTHFSTDWAGQPARPGRPAVPGVIEQMAMLSTEVSQVGTIARQAAAAAEDAAKNSKPNGGSSAFDELIRRFDALEKQNDSLEEVMETSIADRELIHKQLDELATQIEKNGEQP